MTALKHPAVLTNIAKIMLLSRTFVSDDERVNVKYCVTGQNSTNVLAQVVTAVHRKVGNYLPVVTA